MRALAGWIAGIFGLGLAIGSFFVGTAAEKASDVSDLAGTPVIECGDGKEAVVEHVLRDGETVARIRCVSREKSPQPERSARSSMGSRDESRSEPDRPSEGRGRSEVMDDTSRSTKDSALIIGGSAGAGAGIGAIAGGKKGAALGAAIGGVAGTVYDLSTRKKK